MKILVGIDEAGRGPLAGPVAVGVFVFLNVKAGELFHGVKDSKQLTEIKREKWFDIIKEAKKLRLIDFHVSFQSSKIIDAKGISHAIRTALKDALKKLKIKSSNSLILLDGGLKAPKHFKNQKTIIKGDEKEPIIALASICAKVLRDRRMKNLAKKYPFYGFEIHKGYGTKKHYKAIKKHGPCKSQHRLTFL